MNPLLNFLIIWLIFLPWNYINIRKVLRRADSTWTKGSRLLAVICSLAGGPILLFATSTSELLEIILDSDWGKKEVKW
jgi:hypothetical protein